MLSHIVSPCYIYLQVPDFIKRIFYTVSYGGTGVSVFFVLSGFLITSLLIKEKTETGKINLFNFYVRRSLRIWPLYMAVIAFAFGLYPLLKKWMGLNQTLATNVWYHLSFLANFDVLNVRAFHTGQDAMSQNVNWSISVEEQFYIFWPLLFSFFSAKTWRYGIGVILVLCVLFRLQHNASFDYLYFHTLAVLPDMAIGGLFAALIAGSESLLQFFKNQNSTKQIAVVLVLFTLLYFSPQLSTVWYMPAFYRVIIDILIAYLICAQAYSAADTGFAGANWKFASNWGKYTYGIYLLHPIALLLVNTSLRLAHVPITTAAACVLQAILSVPLTFVLSWFSYRYFESYFLGLKQKFGSLSPKR